MRASSRLVLACLLVIMLCQAMNAATGFLARGGAIVYNDMFVRKSRHARESVVQVRGEDAGNRGRGMQMAFAVK
jgi:hypothetical protein